MLTSESGPRRPERLAQKYGRAGGTLVEWTKFRQRENPDARPKASGIGEPPSGSGVT